MKKNQTVLQEVIHRDFENENNDALKKYALESFAREVDDRIQKELFTRLLLDYRSITQEREGLYKELSRSEESLQEAQSIAMLGRWDLKKNVSDILWSKSMYDILEIPHKQRPTLEFFFSCVHPEDAKEVETKFNSLFELKEPWEAQYRLQMEDGRVKWVHLRCNPEKDELTDEITHYYGTIQDITDMKKAEEELEKYNLHLEELVEEKIKEISDSQIATIYALIKLSESRDDDTGTHIERTASFCQLLAQKSQNESLYLDEIDDTFIQTIYKASPLHDIGKVGIPDNILLKPGKLTDEEFNIMKTHVQIGYETLDKIQAQYNHNAFLKMGMEITLYHHEKWNGSGYIQGLSGQDIPLSARIMAIADVYDALRSKRVYKDAFSHEKSLKIILSGKGTHFDPKLIEVFAKFHQEFQHLYSTIE